MADRAAAFRFRNYFLGVYSKYLRGDISKEHATKEAQAYYNESVAYDFDAIQMFIPYTLHALGVKLDRDDSLYDYDWSPYYRGVKNKKRKHLVVTCNQEHRKFILTNRGKFVEIFDVRADLDRYILENYGELWIK